MYSYSSFWVRKIAYSSVVNAIQRYLKCAIGTTYILNTTWRQCAAWQWLSGQSVWLAMDKREFKFRKAHIFNITLVTLRGNVFNWYARLLINLYLFDRLWGYRIDIKFCWPSSILFGVKWLWSFILYVQYTGIVLYCLCSQCKDF